MSSSIYGVTPDDFQVSRAIWPKSSLPKRLIIETLTPNLPAATAWLEPLPPGPRENEFPKTVSPIMGILSARYAVSATNTPKITT